MLPVAPALTLTLALLHIPRHPWDTRFEPGLALWALCLAMALLSAPVVPIPGHPQICGTALPLAKRAHHANSYTYVCTRGL